MKLILIIVTILVLLFFIALFGVGWFIRSINKSVNEKDYNYLN